MKLKSMSITSNSHCLLALHHVHACVDWGGSVMDIGYLLTRSMSQHMLILRLLGLNGDSLISSVTFSTFLIDTRIH